MSYFTSAVQFDLPHGWRRDSVSHMRIPIDKYGCINKRYNGVCAVRARFVVPMKCVEAGSRAITLTEQIPFDEMYRNEYTLERSKLIEEEKVIEALEASQLSATLTCHVSVFLDEWGPIRTRTKVKQRWALDDLHYKSSLSPAHTSPFSISGGVNTY